MSRRDTDSCGHWTKQGKSGTKRTKSEQPGHLFIHFRRPARALLVESGVGDHGCQSHITAVAGGALAVYLYFSIMAPSSLRKEPTLPESLWNEPTLPESLRKEPPLTLPLPQRLVRRRQRQEPQPGRLADDVVRDVAPGVVWRVRGLAPAGSRKTLAAGDADKEDKVDKVDVGETDSVALPPAYYVLMIVFMLIFYKMRFVILRKMRCLFI